MMHEYQCLLKSLVFSDNIKRAEVGKEAGKIHSLLQNETAYFLNF